MLSLMIGAMRRAALVVASKSILIDPRMHAHGSDKPPSAAQHASLESRRGRSAVEIRPNGLCAVVSSPFEGIGGSALPCLHINVIVSLRVNRAANEQRNR
jgi:hypothetical protein